MTFTYGLKSPRDMLAKLHRDRARLVKQITPDRFFNFVVTGYHVLDWLRNDPSVPPATQAAATKMRREPSVAICRDLANASKHFTLDKGYQNQVVEKTSVLSGYAEGRYGSGAYGTGEDTVVIVLTDGQRVGVLEFADRVTRAWDGFFSLHGL